MNALTSAESATSAPTRVLVVEDDPRLRHLVAAFLRDESFEVDEAGTGTEALAHIVDERPAIMLLDIHLPEMDGSQLVDELRRRDISIPVVVMTAARDAREWAQELGAVSYISKPVSLPSLVRRLEALSP